MKDNTECCPHCGHTTGFDVNELDAEGKLTCSGCGKRILACSVCERIRDIPLCDWSAETGKCSFKLAVD